MKHEWNIFEQDPGDPSRTKQSEHVGNEPRLATADPCRFPGLAQILARKSGGEHIDIRRKTLKRSDGSVGEASRKMSMKDGSGRRVNLTQELRAMPSPIHPELEAADPRKQTGNGESSSLLGHDV
jgi:hypothetical protein